MGIYSVKSNLWMYKMITIPICISHIYGGYQLFYSYFSFFYSDPTFYSFIPIKREFKYDIRYDKSTWFTMESIIIMDRSLRSDHFIWAILWISHYIAFWSLSNLFSEIFLFGRNYLWYNSYKWFYYGTINSLFVHVLFAHLCSVVETSRNNFNVLTIYVFSFL